MKPVLVLQHMNPDGPAYLGTWLREQGVRFEVRNTEAGDAFPERMAPYSALAVLGGEMSANDALPSLRQAERLILDAMASERPVIGHCLGGQLMARALGAAVTRSPTPEIGWQPARLHAHEDEARAWFGEAADITVFHWHGEAFALPNGATALATSDACPVQAFSVGMHLAMQFHVEIDDEKLGAWSASRDAAFFAAQRLHATVQSGEAMREGAKSNMADHQRLARRIYERWLGFASRN